MRPIIPLTLTWLLIASSMTSAEVLSTREAIRQQTGAFMDMIANGRVVAAYNSLRPFLGVDAGAYDESAKEAATYFQQVRQQAGEPVGSSHVTTEVIASDFTRETWLQKFEAAAIAWRFTYYQPDVSGWKLMGVSYSTELDALYHSPD
ncbi:hypothetical protein [Marinobacter sp. F4206]|uniref:hypothetical protein n=1 Tax=Marinobacter sp. F4206 TaxID=2861777 RepID=UPI001C5FD4EB|nr:hypothetical protein [Marinobacter sp. F4206]MBW4934328.1 hypothetical protein [Marinobacter sp. F4206]